MYNHKKVESDIADWWEKNKIFEKSVETRPKGKQYVFYDGPPFATGLPHYGHILGLTSKDLFPRFWTMKGFSVERRWGWDCHGLPVEVIAEKELGIKSKKQIEEMGVAKFNEFCKSKVLHFAQEWKKTVRRMGKWIDFDNAYRTMDQSYMESVWHIIKKLYEEKYLYEGKKILLYCSRCETPLASSEITMDNSYKDVTEPSATAKFRLQGKEDIFLLSWTTTPWTLIGNVALAVNLKLTYVQVKVGAEQYILAKERLAEIKNKYSIIKTMKGEELIHRSYEPLYTIKAEKKGHYIINGGDEVSAQEGTGIVHMAAYGEFDYQMIKKYNLPFIQHVDKGGKIHLGPKEFTGLWFKKADEAVIQNLEKRRLLFAKESFTHPYPFCYRCNTPLFYNALDSWFIDIQRIKKKLIEKNENINWYPDHIKHKRFKNVLETAPDWSISRNRFWATALPIWKCKKCNALEVIGSIEELKKKAREEIPANIDLHKHVMDTIHLDCKCKGIMERIPEVLDCWMESGSMPYGAKHYPFENKEWLKKNFPADFVSEYMAQVRTWFYYMHVLSVILFDQAPFKNVVVTGTMLAADGTKMSKSRGNFPEPEKIFDLYGADALRFYLMQSPLMRAEDLNFQEESVKEVYRKVIMLLFNVHQFYELHGAKNKIFDKPGKKHIMDQWIVNKLNMLIRDVNYALENYDTVMACNELESFINDLSLWYVRRSRERFTGKSEQDRDDAIRTLSHVLMIVVKLLAPISPFIAEVLFQTYRKSNSSLAESVHLENWPAHDESLISAAEQKKMEEARELVRMILEQRAKANIPVRQALNKVKITGVSLDKTYGDLIAAEVNVKYVEAQKGKEKAIELDTKLTPELEKEGYVREVIRRIQNLRKTAGLKQEDHIALAIKSAYNLAEAEQEIRERVGAKSIEFGKEFQQGWREKVKIKDEDFIICVRKV